jgi:membrane-associated phospholipid phosphatase
VVEVAMPQPESRPGTLWPIDKLFIAYAAIMVCLLGFAARHDSFALLLISGHVVMVGLIFILATNLSPAARFVRQWSLLVYLPFCYKQVPYLVSALHLRVADFTLAHWDRAMWKVDPVFSLSSAPNHALTEFLEIVYVLFIPSTLLLGVILWVRKSGQEFRRGTFLIAVTFLLSYLGYLLMPARGPRFMDYASSYPPLQGLWTFNFFKNLLDTLEGTQYDCFPSGHVAVVLVGAYVARRISTPAFYCFAAFAACITFSTVYLRYHYVIDVIAGMALAVAVVTGGPWIYRKLDLIGYPVAESSAPVNGDE